MGGQEAGRLVALEFQGQLEGRFEQPVGQAGGNGGQIFLQTRAECSAIRPVGGAAGSWSTVLPGAGPIAR